MTVNNFLTEFQHLLSEAQAAGTESELFLQIMEPQTAKQFRLCAIPHQFDSKILRILVPELDEDQAQRRCEEFSRLSAVIPAGEKMSIHDNWRREIFSKWLQPNNYPEFQTASLRLANFFYKEFDIKSGVKKDSAIISYMYHLLGSDQSAGFAQFEVLFIHARKHLRLAECSTLIKLLHDYDVILSTENAARLLYQEGKLATDQCNWAKAENIFTDLSQQTNITPILKAKSFRRLGYVFSSQGHYDAAIKCQRSALKIAESNSEVSQIIPSIIHEMGVAYRDKGDFDEAEKILNESVEHAVLQKNKLWIPIIFNSLGNLYLKQSHAQQAISAFKSALEKLNETEDIIQMSQIYNNLGSAYSECGAWQASQDWYIKSLQIKRKSGDLLGEASALNNLSRVYYNGGKKDEAIANTCEAARLYELVGELNKAGACKTNLGKYYLKMGNKDLARQSLTEAIEFFVRAKNTFAEQESRIVLDKINKQQRIPWWAWLSICIFLSGVAVIIFM